VIQGEPSKLQDWEWRDAEYARRRERARLVARRRGRLRLAALALGTAAIVVSALVAARALSLPAPYARASLAVVDGTTRGSVAVMASRIDNEQTANAGGAAGTATWDQGEATVSSTVADGALISTATVTLTHLSLLGGRVTADSMDLVADAAATKSAESGGVNVSRITGLQVDGQAVPLDSLPLTIDGVGTLTALETREADDGTGLEAEVTGLRLHLTSAWRGLAEGADIVVGSAAACADETAAAHLLPKPVPSDSDGGSSSSGGSSSGGSGSGSSGSSGSSDDKDNGGGTGGSGGGGNTDSSSADTFRPGKMHSPTKSSGDLIPFPGAVFPIDGEVWYSDDFGAPRAVGGGHTGNDIFARRGTPLVAVQAGTVQELRYRSLGGNSFHLVNDRGDYFYYAHLMRYAAGITNGSVVEAGQVLGYVGNTGNAITTPPHLHFEIHPGGGAPIDPFPYLELWRGQAAATAQPADSAGPHTQARPSDIPPAVSLEAEMGRHQQAVVRAGFAPRTAQGGDGMTTLLPAALSFGILGGLTTSAVRRRRTQFRLLTMGVGELHRAAKPG
jgi:murein DD-endopeptidase MepM/ murein hydrolase activator NlpD